MLGSSNIHQSHNIPQGLQKQIQQLGTGQNSAQYFNGKRKRDREPAWTVAEMLALARAKRQEWENQINGSRTEKGKSKVQKWTEIVNMVKEYGVDRLKWQKVEDKWDNMYQDFKKVCLWQCRMGSPDYWRDLNRQGRKENNLPVNFDEEVFAEMHGFLSSRVVCMHSDGIETESTSKQIVETPPFVEGRPMEDSTPMVVSHIGQGGEVEEQHGNGIMAEAASIMKQGKLDSLPLSSGSGTSHKSKASFEEDALKEEDKTGAWLREHVELEREKIGLMREQGQAVISALEKIASALCKLVDKV